MKKLLFYIPFSMILACPIFSFGFDPKCIIKLGDIFRNSPFFSREETLLRERHLELTSEIAELRENTPLSPFQESLLKGKLKMFVLSMKSTLESQPNIIIRGLMDSWVESRVKKYGYLPGFERGPVPYRNVDKIQKDISNKQPWRFLNIYFNSMGPMEPLYTLFSVREQIGPSLLHSIEIALPDVYEALLIREYARRFIRNVPDITHPGDGSAHQIYDSIENRMQSVFPN